VDNAVKYGQRARVQLLASESAVTVHVDDDGPGIPREEQERVFAPFVRLDDSRNRDTGGTGLGLTIARTIARAHGGDVSLANRPGGGLRVTISLPR
jgi:signal transduction histidine kinase